MSSFKLVHSFECFCDHFGDQEMLLVIHFDGKSILERTQSNLDQWSQNKQLFSFTDEFAQVAGYVSEERSSSTFYHQNLNLSWILPLSSCYYKLGKNPLGAFPVDGSEYSFQQLCILIAVEPECYSLFSVWRPKCSQI